MLDAIKHITDDNF